MAPSLERQNAISTKDNPSKKELFQQIQDQLNQCSEKELARLLKGLQESDIIYFSQLNLDDAAKIIHSNPNHSPELSKTENKKERLQAHIDHLCSLTMADGLTGLFNRRYFDHRIAYEMRRVKREFVPCSIILLDVDHFKKINDSHGHAIGDEVLKQVASVIGETLRQTDIITRFGGEEFAVILPLTGFPEAKRASERVRCAIEKHDFQIEETSELVTISAGVSTLLPTEELTPQEFICQADQALYQAKEAGRNQSRSYQRESDIKPAGVSAQEKDELLL